jgi:predicted secreted hydrolase
VSRIKTIEYKGKDHGHFDEEWLAHKGCSEWWYTTGVFNDENGKMYSWQCTLIKTHILFLRPFVIMLALTDFETGKHRYYQNITLSSKKVHITEEGVGFGDVFNVTREKDGMHFSVHHKSFMLDLILNYGKGAVWHCDNGLLQMGIPHQKQQTLYYSYTNMPTSGIMTLDGKEYKVKGKSWFDKQGGTYEMKNRLCMWEWFSLRFHDDEEMMLFSFPHVDYRDGTYIHANGEYSRLNSYSVEPLDFVYPDGKTKYSNSWKITVPGYKDEEYTVTPLMEGQMNIGYYEQLAEITNKEGKQVGLCFVELLPGVYNEKYPDTVFSKVEV